MNVPLWAAAAAAVLGAGITWGVRVGRERAARARRLRSQETERQAFVGTLAAGLAHEMRNPLSTLRMHLELLKEDWASPVTERERAGARRLDGILQETKRLEDTLADFLRFAVKQQLQRAPVDLVTMIRELTDFVGPNLQRHGLRLESSCAPDLPILQADPGLLRHAVLNLLLNACEASRAGDTVTLRAERDGRQVAIRVVDRGTGIEPQHLERIFEVYFSTKPSGTGLGLPTAKRIVEQHGGTISVESAPSRGSTFTIRLPVESNHG
jgi:signal transduction histidine kinase